MAHKKVKYWFDKELAIMLADKICEIKSDFNKKRFTEKVDKGTTELEVKDRVELIADHLYYELGENYKDNVQILMGILGDENQNETGMFTEFYWVMPIAKFVEKYGLNDFELSMKAIIEITKRNTSEYAIRPYLRKETDRTLKKMEEWSKDNNFHVRRLSSEGVRPRLPWAKKLDIFIEDPKKILPILNNLKDDKSKFVQKSVANCINDIFKDNYDIAKELIEQWNVENIGKERKWIIKHSLRKLVKNEDKWAIKMIK